MKPPEFILYHHKNEGLAKYVAYYSDIKTLVPGAKIRIESIPQHSSHSSFSELPQQLRRLLFFARPDVVICIDDFIRPVHPIFAFEITEHVPARDHWMQRFVNLVGCAQEGVPGAYVMPFDMSKHPSFPSTIDSYFFFAYDRVTEIHQIPIFIAEWETANSRTPRRYRCRQFMRDTRTREISDPSSGRKSSCAISLSNAARAFQISRRCFCQRRSVASGRSQSAGVPFISKTRWRK
jgi:hypothetical protein